MYHLFLLGLRYLNKMLHIRQSSSELFQSIYILQLTEWIGCKSMSTNQLLIYCYIRVQSNMFEEAEGWQELSRHYGSSSIIYICKRYKLSTTIIEDQIYAFKTMTLPLTNTNSSSVTRTQLSLKFKDQRQIKSEIIALQKLQNYPSIIRLHQVILQQVQKNDQAVTNDFYHRFLKRKYKNSRSISMILEYCNQGTLEQYLKRITNISQQQIIKIALQILNGLLALKEQHIVHRDLRPINILISAEGLKICDFDIAFIEGFSEIGDLFTSMVEKVVAPEIHVLMESSYQNKLNYTSGQIYQALHASDLYSLGVLLFQIAFKMPFERKQFGLKLELYEWKHSLELKNVITGLLRQDLKDRLEISEARAILQNILKQQVHQHKSQKLRDIQEYTFDVNLIDIEQIYDGDQQQTSLSNSISDWSISDQTLVTSKQICEKIQDHCSKQLIDSFHKIIEKDE